MIWKKRRNEPKEQQKEEALSKDLSRVLSDSISNLDAKELFDLAKQVSEKHLDKSDEMYQFFHDEDVEKAVNNL